jgi:membrane-associated phospholipid phosphatase
MKVIANLVLMLSLSFSVFSQNGDINLLRKINGSYTLSGGNFFQFITDTDDPVTFGFPGVLIVKGLVTKNKSDLWNSTEMLSTSLISSLMVYGLKSTFQRDRPFITYPDIVKHTHGGSYSMPSGHTSICFATATAVSLIYPKWYVIAPMYTWASLVGYSRMYLGVHYPTDILAGAIVGSGSALGIHYLFKYIKKKVEQKKAPEKL